MFMECRLLTELSLAGFTRRSTGVVMPIQRYEKYQRRILLHFLKIQFTKLRKKSEAWKGHKDANFR